jgi:ribosomal peptide maturation radical SAM protein 1
MDRATDRSIVLVNMPWALYWVPSIPLGILSAVLRADGLAPVVRSYNLTFIDFLGRVWPEEEGGFTLRDYEQLADNPRLGLGDWVFAVPPFRGISPAGDEEYLAWVARESPAIDPAFLAKVAALRAHIPAFIDTCVQDLLDQRPAMVGFTTTFSQNVSSLLLARRLKERDPSPVIVFGGANCDGEMGQAVFDAFPWVDVVVRGEGELVVAEIAREALAHGCVSPRAGVLTRTRARAARGDRPVLQLAPRAAAESTPRPKMDDIPTPDYDSYFEALASSPYRDEILTSLVIPIETARGCWWGEKQHCTFCGLNGSSMAFRSKSVERAFSDLVGLAARHRCLNFAAVDNIIDLDYLRELLPRLRDSGIDFHIFYETKANLSKAQVRAMWESGIRHIQPGIESLSTPILRLMRKGVPAWRNVQLLKWAMQYGIRVDWNLLYAFPGEPPEEYARMSAVIPSLTHLQPPAFARVKVQRFSPYHQRPGEFGIRLDGPSPFYRAVYPDGVRLHDLAYYFDYSYLDERDPEDYVGDLRDAVATWNEVHDRSRGSLTYRHGPEFVRIVDNRELGYTSYLLEGEQAAAYLACDGGVTVAAVCGELARQGYTGVSPEEVEEFLRELVEARLMFESDDHFVSLALPAQAQREATRRAAPSAPPVARSADAAA